MNEETVIPTSKSPKTTKHLKEPFKDNKKKLYNVIHSCLYVLDENNYIKVEDNLLDSQMRKKKLNKALEKINSGDALETEQDSNDSNSK